MAHYGQHSGGIEAQSTLRILYEGARNSYGTNLVTDAFTQTNPPVITTPGTVSTTLHVPPRGILAGSICFTRPEANGHVGGPTASAPSRGAVRPLGFFINGAADFTYGNLPTQGSGQGTYITGTLGIGVYETFVLDGPNVGDPLLWAPGDFVYASRNGYITNRKDAHNALEAAHGYADVSHLGVVKVVVDSVHPDIVLESPV